MQAYIHHVLPTSFTWTKLNIRIAIFKYRTHQLVYFEVFSMLLCLRIELMPNGVPEKLLNKATNMCADYMIESAGLIFN